MRRSAFALAAVLAFGLTGCDHGSSHHKAAVLRAPSPYTPRAVQRAFERAGVWLARDRESEAFMRGSGDTSFVAFFEDATGDVQANISRPVEPGAYRISLVSEGSVDKTLGTSRSRTGSAVPKRHACSGRLRCSGQPALMGSDPRRRHAPNRALAEKRCQAT
jgi:hypothetical protein